MTITVEIDGTPIADAIPPSSIAGQSIAKDGDVGFGGFVIDDPGADITTVGHKLVTIEESDCSQPRLFTGYLTERGIGRSTDRGMVVADDRLHDPSIVDLNAIFSFRIITYAGGNRPAETMGERLTWLLGYQALVNLVEDTGFVDWDILTLGMDAADYTGGTPKSVLDDLVGRRPNITYFAFWDATATPSPTVSLYFGGDSAGIGESTLAISNDLVDIDGSTIFPPDSEAKLRRTPEEVYSEVQVNYARGTKRTYRKRASISTEFIARGTVIDRPYTMSKTTAQAQAETFLDMHSKEQDTITCTVLVPPESAGLIVAGQRIDCKFVHLPGYEDWTSLRVTSVNVRLVNDVANRYFLDLELEAPIAAPTPPATNCDGTYAKNALAGLTATVESSGTSRHTIGAGIYNLDEATDNNLSTAAEWKAELWGGTFWRDFIFTPASAISINSVSITGLIKSEPFGTALGLERMSVLVNGVQYDGSYAVGSDANGWYLASGTSTATFYFPATITDVTEVRVRATMTGSLYNTGVYFLVEVAACDVTSGVTPDETEDAGPMPGTTVAQEAVTPYPDGSETSFTTSAPYMAGTLRVYVDGLLIPSFEVSEDDPIAGEFTLSWAPDADEVVTATYTVG